MGVIQILLIIFGILNLFFAGYLFFYSDRSIAAVFYTLILVFASLWSVATLLVTAAGLPFSLFVVALNGHYVLGYLAYLSFFLFSLYYPFKNTRFITLSYVMAGITIAFLPVISFSHLFFTSLRVAPSFSEQIVFNSEGYVVFILFLSGVFFAGLLNLLWKMRWIQKDSKYASVNPSQVKYALIANFVAGTFGIILNLIFPLYGNFLFFSINPIFVIVALIGIGLVNLIKYKLFNARLILAELFTVGVCVMFFARLVISPDQMELETNSIFFAGAVCFGYFLIKSVRLEVQALDNEEKLAAELEISNARLRELDVQKSEFLSFASHQLRTPLTAIKWGAGALLDKTYGDIPANLQEPIQTIFDESSLMAVLVNDYLNVSRIEQGKMQYQFAPIDLAEVLKSVAKQLGPALKAKGLALSSDFGKERTMVWGDSGKLTQIFGNIIDNAMKYTPQGSIHISLKKVPERSIARVEMRDTGIGMDEVTRNKIFDKFVRGENATEVNNGGSGLGLFIVKTFVEAHKGKIWAESEGLNKGTLFVVEVPLLIQK